MAELFFEIINLVVFKVLLLAGSFFPKGIFESKQVPKFASRYKSKLKLKKC